MKSEQLITSMNEMNIDPKGLAYLLGVTARAVNMWCAGTREIPGPVEAYLNLLKSVPRANQMQEISRIYKEKPIMYDGMYLVQYVGTTGTGQATLIFYNGLVFGQDVGGAQYDGSYAPSANDPKVMDVCLNLLVPKGTTLVQGVPSQDMEYSFEIDVKVPALTEHHGTPMAINTPFGEIVIKFSFLRALPPALAA